MKRKYALPIAAALVFHAALLFGFHGKLAVVQEAETMGCDLREASPPILEVITFPEPDDVTTNDDQNLTRLGDPEVTHVTLPDVARTAPPKSFTIPAEPREAVVKVDTNHINPGMMGDRDGDIRGVLKSGSIITAGMLDNRPRAIVQTSPIYPGEAKINGMEGQVLLGFTVDEDGRVNAPYVIRCTNRVFEEAALRAVLKWRFEPGRRDGRVVRYRMAVPIVFSLNS